MSRILINTKSMFSKAVAKFHSPEQRLFLGLTALPCLSLYDCFTSPDEQTKKASLAKSWAKIIAGTLTGVTIRYAGIAAAKRFAKAAAHYKFPNSKDIIIVERDKVPKYSILYPKKWLGERKMNIDDFLEELNDFHKSLGTYLAIVVMLFTNFVVDAPLTMFLTNFFRKNVFKLDDKKSSGEQNSTLSSGNQKNDIQKADIAFMRNVVKESGFSFDKKGGAK